MYRLPDLEPWCDSQCWISSAGATELACQLLCEPGELRWQHWLELLGWEPGLVLWAASGLRWRLDEPPQLEELAAWLEEAAASQLRSDHDRQTGLTTDQQANVSRQSGAAVAIARGGPSGDEPSEVDAIEGLE